jgi:hypothetical protein
MVGQDLMFLYMMVFTFKQVSRKTLGGGSGPLRTSIPAGKRSGELRPYSTILTSVGDVVLLYTDIVDFLL